MFAIAINNKIRALMNLKGKKSSEAAEYFGITVQAMRNKMSRGSFSAADLVKFASFLDCELSFIVDDKQKVSLDLSDIQLDNNNLD